MSGFLLSGRPLAANRPALVLTGDAPDGTIGDTYAYTYALSGGRPPYTVSIEAGELPPGIGIVDTSLAAGDAPALSGQFVPPPLTYIVSFDDAPGSTTFVSEGLERTIMSSATTYVPVATHAISRFGAGSVTLFTDAGFSQANVFDATGTPMPVGAKWRIEGWARCSASPSPVDATFGLVGPVYIGVNTGQIVTAKVTTAVGSDSTGVACPLGSFFHWCIQGENGVFAEAFINGVRVARNDNPATVPTVSNVGTVQFGRALRGQIDEVRVQANPETLYPTGGFTPPTGPFVP